jgi:hypothetical protein
MQWQPAPDARRDLRQQPAADAAASTSFVTGLMSIAPILIVGGLVALILGRWRWAAGISHVDALAPKFSRLDPLAGMKRMFGTHGMVEVLKAVGKFGLVLAFAIAAVRAKLPHVAGLEPGQCGLEPRHQRRRCLQHLPVVLRGDAGDRVHRRAAAAVGARQAAAHVAPGDPRRVQGDRRFAGSERPSARRCSRKWRAGA